jgi:hypothetical protein
MKLKRSTNTPTIAKSSFRIISKPPSLGLLKTRDLTGPVSSYFESGGYSLTSIHYYRVWDGRFAAPNVASPLPGNNTTTSWS